MPCTLSTGRLYQQCGKLPGPVESGCLQTVSIQGKGRGITADSEQGLESPLAKGCLSLEEWKVAGEAVAWCLRADGSAATCPGSACELGFPSCGMDMGASVEVNPLATEPRAPRQLWRGPG